MPTDRRIVHQQQTRQGIIEVFEKTVDKHTQRLLEFGDGVVQSAIDINNPCHLPLVVNQAMLAVLMFVTPPKQVLLLGTGGGAMARYFSQKNIGGEAVEILEDISDTAKKYFDFPKQQKGWQLIVADAKDYMTKTDKEFDLVFVDIAKAGIKNNAIFYNTPDWIFNSDYLQLCRQRLTTSGALIINILADDETSFRKIAQKARLLFNKQVLFFNVRDYNNIIMLAFREPPTIFTERITSAKYLKELEQRWEIDFEPYRDMILNQNPAGCGVL